MRAFNRAAHKIYTMISGLYHQHIHTRDLISPWSTHEATTKFELPEIDQIASDMYYKGSTADEVIFEMKSQGYLDPDYHYFLLQQQEGHVKPYYYLGQTYRNTPSLFVLSPVGSDTTEFSRICSYLLLNRLDKVFDADSIDTELNLEYHNLKESRRGYHRSSGAHQVVDTAIVNFIRGLSIAQEENSDANEPVSREMSGHQSGFRKFQVTFLHILSLILPVASIPKRRTP